MVLKSELKNEIKELELSNYILQNENLYLKSVSNIKGKSYWEKLTEVFTPLVLIMVFFLMWVPIIYYMLILLTN